MHLKLLNGMNSVTVNDLSWLGRAIIIHEFIARLSVQVIGFHGKVTLSFQWYAQFQVFMVNVSLGEVDQSTFYQSTADLGVGSIRSMHNRCFNGLVDGVVKLKVTFAIFDVHVKYFMSEVNGNIVHCLCKCQQ